MTMAAFLFNTLSLFRSVYTRLKPYPRSTKVGIPVPAQCHAVLTDEEIGDRPLLIIGDVHGCLDELQELIKQAEKVVGIPDIFLVFVGDMCNKGPKNWLVLSFIRDLVSKGNAAAVKGNHEESILREYWRMTNDDNYVLSSKYEYLSDFSQDDFTYIHNLPYSLTIPKINSVVVHAGLLPGVSLEHQSIIDICHMRNVEHGVKVWGPTNVALSKPVSGVGWATLWEGPQHVYFGHDARRGLQLLSFATGLDTGCVYGGKLTGIVIDNAHNKTIVSVTSKGPYRGYGYSNGELLPTSSPS